MGYNLKDRILLAVESFLIWLAVVLIGKTLRIVQGAKRYESEALARNGSCIYALWHGRMFLVVWVLRHRNIVALTSQHRDGELISRILKKLGFDVVRGSTSKGGSRALIEMIRMAKQRPLFCITPDGPRGPRSKVQPGIVFLAHKTGFPIVPIVGGSRWKKEFKSWDKFQLPLPFSRCSFIYGEPFYVGGKLDDDRIVQLCQELENRLNEVTVKADKLSKSGRRAGFLHLIYDLVTTLVFVFALPYILIAALLNKQGMRDRLSLPRRRKDKGLKSDEKTEISSLGENRGDLVLSRVRVRNEEVIWFHAASVGEVSVAASLITHLRQIQPDCSVVVSTVTVTGLERARQTIPDAAFHFVVPLDLPFLVSRIFDRIKPCSLIIAESDFWPNMIRYAEGNGCRIGVVNGKISQRSFVRYSRYAKGFASGLFEKIDLFSLQSEDDKLRLLRLGVAEEKIVVLGNVKISLISKLLEADNGILKQSFGLKDNERLIVAGSTREGEEEIIMKAFTDLRHRFPNLRLVLAPRHLKRVEEVERIVKNSGFIPVRKTRLTTVPSGASDVVILDTMGELSRLYSVADVAFVGGSLVPLGGHNPFEAAVYGVPMVFGPYMQQEGAELLLEIKAAVQVRNDTEFSRELIRILSNPEIGADMGKAGRDMIAANSGLALKTVEILIEKGIL